MRNSVLTWIFACFVYMKAAFEFAAIQDLPVLAALLIALAFGWYVALGETRYGETINYNSNIREIRGSLVPRISKTLPWMALHTLCWVIAARVILYAFARDLSREIGLFGNFAGLFDPDLAWFALIVLVPAVTHWLYFIATYVRPGIASGDSP